jgi:hypothetical protein
MTSQALYMDDLVADAVLGNRVQVVKFQACRPKPNLRAIRKAIEIDDSERGAATPAMLILADHVRLLRGQKAIYLPEVLRRLGGKLMSVTPNVRATIGTDLIGAQLFNTQAGSAIANFANYVALSNNTNAASSTEDASVAPWSTGVATDGAAGGARGEWTGLGLTRAAAALAHTTLTSTVTATITFTATGTSTSTQKCGLFGGSAKTAQGTSVSTNILLLTNVFTPTSLVNTDQLSLTWTITI